MTFDISYTELIFMLKTPPLHQALGYEKTKYWSKIQTWYFKYTNPEYKYMGALCERIANYTLFGTELFHLSNWKCWTWYLLKICSLGPGGMVWSPSALVNTLLTGMGADNVTSHFHFFLKVNISRLIIW